MASRASLPPVEMFADDRTHAATLKPSSSSIASKGVNPFHGFNLEVNARGSTDLVHVCAKRKWYNLADLTRSTKTATRGVSDQVCLEYLESVFTNTNKYKCVKEQVEMFNMLPPLYCTDRQTPDICVYLKKNGKKMLVLLVEVHSSPYANSINKVVIGVIEQLRLYRMTNPDKISCIGFAFPKLPSPSDNHASMNKQSVTQVTVTWANFSFVYDLKSLQHEEVTDSLKAAVKVNGSLFLEHPVTSAKHIVVQLSISDMGAFGAGAIQVASRSSILVRANERYYKLPTTSDALRTLLKLVVHRPSQHIVPLQLVWVNKVEFISCPQLAFDPMNRCEASQCLKELVTKVAHAILDLHSHDWAHQDIRLDNICFDSNYHPILIDLDRLRYKFYEPLRFDESCMYQEHFDPTRMDWLQLGWLAAWAYCSQSLTLTTNYHEMKVDDLPSECKKDTFLMGLIRQGEYSYGELGSSIISTSNHQDSISVVLADRNRHRLYQQ